MNLASAAVLGFALALLAGCGKDEGKRPVTQVAAKVNADEITVHQLNSVLARTPAPTPELAERAKREILERLVDQQLAKQQAIDRKLDRSPAVQQALEAARNEILARAYVEQIAAAQPKPSPEEMMKYYAEHPELFAQRRLYSLEELALNASPAVGAELRQRAAKARSLKELADWLDAQGVRVAPSRGIRAAEQIPLEVLPKLQKVRDGEMLVLENGTTWQVIRVVASRSAPVDEATAMPRIQQFLSNRRATEAIANEMKQLKAGAKIEYMGEFAEGAAGAEARAQAVAKAKARAEVDAKAKADAEMQARAEETTKARMAAETKARLEAEAKARADQGAAPNLSQEAIKKGVGAIR